MIAQNPSLAKLENLVGAAEELSAWVHQAAQQGTPAHEVEREIFRRVLAIGRMALGQFFTSQGTGDLGETVTLPEGRTLRRLPATHTREYVSIFGPFPLERTVYGTREGQKIELVPLDARLALPESKFSYVLQDWDQRIATEQPYGQVAQFLEAILGLRQHVDNLERMSRHLADDAEAFAWSYAAPPPEEEGELVVESADGKGVPIRRPADAPPIQDHQHQRGPKPDRKRMATVGAVYSVDRFVRTPEEVVEALFHDPQAPAPARPRPRPQHKRVYAQLTCENAEGETIDGPAAVFGWLDQEVRQRRSAARPTVVSLMDGQESLWETKAAFQDDLPTVDILDLLHVTPRLWQAAHLFHRAGSPAAEAFVRERVQQILEGRVLAVVRGLRSLATRRRLSPSRRKTLETICGYFEKNHARMRYDEYLKQGYPIASGVIEGACRHVVKDRLERTGMSWTKTGAQALLHLRAIAVSDHWQDFIAFRIEHETERLYPQRQTLNETHWATAP
jgi:hypothetical protein